MLGNRRQNNLGGNFSQEENVLAFPAKVRMPSAVNMTGVTSRWDSEFDKLQNIDRSIYKGIASSSQNLTNRAQFSSENVFKSTAQDRRDAVPQNDDVTDAKIAASEARSETRVVRLEGRLDTQFATTNAALADLGRQIATLSTSVTGAASEARSNRNQIVLALAAAVLSILAIMIGVLAYGSGAFYNGTVVRDITKTVIQEVGIVKTQPTQNAK